MTGMVGGGGCVSGHPYLYPSPIHRRRDVTSSDPQWTRTSVIESRGPETGGKRVLTLRPSEKDQVV